MFPTRTRPARCFSFERLESRQTMSVSPLARVAVVGGELQLVGNANHNQIALYARNDAGTSWMVEQRTPQGTITRQYDRVTRGIWADLGQGNDMLKIDGQRVWAGTSERQATLAGTIEIAAGAGSDSVDIQNLQLNGRLAIDTGSQNDTVSLSNLRISNNLDIQTGAHDDTVQIAQVAVGVNETIRTEDGNDTVLTSQHQVRARLSVDTGAGNDRVHHTSTVADAYFANLGDGNDLVSFGYFFGARFRTSLIDGGAGVDAIFAGWGTSLGSSQVKGFEGPTGNRPGLPPIVLL